MRIGRNRDWRETKEKRLTRRLLNAYSFTAVPHAGPDTDRARQTDTVAFRGQNKAMEEN